MAFPTVQTRATYNPGTTVALQPVTLPSGIQAGDILILACSTNGNVFPQQPAGWKTIINNPGGGGATDRCLVVFSRLADGSEGATVTVDIGTTVPLCALTWRISGAEDAEGASASGSSTTPNPPNLAPTWGIEDTLWLALTGPRGSTISAYPGSYTQTRFVNSGTILVAGCERSLRAASENPGTFTKTNDVWVAGTVAIRPRAPDNFLPFFN